MMAKMKDVVALQSAPDRLDLADLKGGQDEIFADQPPPLSGKQVRALGNHRHEKMRLKHPHPAAKRIIETIAARLNPKQHPDKGEIEEKDDMRHGRKRKRQR